MTLPRSLEPLLVAASRTVPVVIVEGGRATGKSTMCDRVIAANGWPPRADLSDPETLALVQLDRHRFLSNQPTPCVIDEAQLDPDLLIAVKRVVDGRPGAGQFVLTGSARLGRHQLGGSDPLAGRAVRLRLWSMTQRELAGLPADVIERAFRDGWHVDVDHGIGGAANWLGGLPGISGVIDGHLTDSWEREVASYVESVIPLGVVGTRVDHGRLLRAFRYLAANSGQLYNGSRAATELGQKASTVQSYVDHLDAAFLVHRIEAHRPSEHRVLTAHPRIVATDPGLATWAGRAWSGPTTAALLGSLTETVVAHSVLAAADAAADRVVVRHWRDKRNQAEVDLVLLHPDGRKVPIEVKASTTAGPADTSGLRAFATEAGDACERAILVYEGEPVLDLTPAGGGPEILAVPRSLI